MGTGFVAALDPDAAESLADETDGRVIGRVQAAEGGNDSDKDEATVEIRGLEL
jgi:phosphoribosylformylglycinamidine cyclo-ligase